MKKDKRKKVTAATKPQRKSSSLNKSKKPTTDKNIGKSLSKKNTGKTSKKTTSKKRTPKIRLKSQINEMLLEMRNELIKGVSQSIKAESDHPRFDVGDFYDHASNDRVRELSLMLTGRERQKLVQIEEALKKLDDGSYGICESCDDEIDQERLKAMPFAELCLSCKIDLERLEHL